MSAVTLTEVRKALAKLVAADPDRKNPKVSDDRADGSACYYTNPDGSPSCVVGNLADVLGLPRPAWGDGDNGEGLDGGFDSGFDLDALCYLAEVQGDADSRARGDAYAQAEEHLRRRNCWRTRPEVIR